MTRDEAFKIMKRPVGGEWEYDWIRRFVELGMLKLDEPKSINQRVKENWSLHESYLPDFLSRLDAAGLKIVEK